LRREPGFFLDEPDSVDLDLELEVRFDREPELRVDAERRKLLLLLADFLPLDFLLVDLRLFFRAAIRLSLVRRRLPSA
jgi:hypothetical protein